MFTMVEGIKMKHIFQLSIRLLVFVLATILCWFFLNGYIQLPFQQGVTSRSWVMPYLYSAGPHVLFFFFVGMVVVWVFNNFLIWRVTILLGLIFNACYLVFFLLFTSYWSLNWLASLMLTAPFFGIVAGIFLGVSTIKLIQFFYRRKI